MSSNNNHLNKIVMTDLNRIKSVYSDFDKIINVGIADIKYAVSPYHLRTNLGSCVALILYDKVKHIGGLAHVMLPKSLKDKNKAGKYADTAAPEIINSMIYKMGCKKKNIVAKIFGGARMLPKTKNDIGNQNISVITELLKKNDIMIEATKTGGTKGYLVQLDTATGEVMCMVFGQEPEYF